MGPTGQIYSMILLLALPAGTGRGQENPRLPWREAGLTERQAAVHLLDRLTYGARPGEVDRVLALGLESWVGRQLAGVDPGARYRAFEKRLGSFAMSSRQILETYPPPGRILRQARAGGMEIDPEAEGARRQVMTFARQQGYRSQRELLGEVVARRLLGAVYSEAQLQEVLIDFWANHFHVSFSDNEARLFLTTYERDAIRPHVLARFSDLLRATAQHPAMLLYLDNARSVAAAGAPRTVDLDRLRRQWRHRRGRMMPRGQPPADRPSGLNENYARELLELHTLGVDGGYTQRDIVEVARAFSGWTTYPFGGDQVAQRRLARVLQLPHFVLEGDFLFRADAHDAGAKTVLGLSLPAGGGVEDGLAVLDLLSRHPATARHLATKLAVRFVADEPPPSLVSRLAAVYLRSEGDLRRMMRVLVESPEFWSREVLRQKIKTPFELVASSLRALDADIRDPRQLGRWLQRMGHLPYGYQAPTGYPHTADAWVHTAALLHRMSFALQLAAGQIRGLSLDLSTLAGREPDSLDSALEIYLPILLPERDLVASLARLRPVVYEPELAARLEREVAALPDPEPAEIGFAAPEGLGQPSGRREAPEALAWVVGVILGSPEFQRR